MNDRLHPPSKAGAEPTPKAVTKKKLKEDAQTLSSMIESGQMDKAATFGAANPHVFSERMRLTVNKLTIHLGEPFLNMAAEKRSLACVEAFIAAGAPLEGRGRTGMTPLLSALRHNNVLIGGEENDRVVMTLLNSGARADAIDDTGEGPIYRCCGDLNHKLTARILQDRPNLDTWNTKHNTPSISLLVGRCNSSGSKERRANLIHLIEAGVDLNPPARDVSMLPLAQALYGNDLALAETMIAHGADWRRCGQDGRSLMFAAMTPQTVQWVLDRDPGLRDATDHRGIPPLQHMVSVALTPDSSFSESVRGAIVSIVLAGADPHAIDNEGPLARTAADRITQSSDTALKSMWRALLAGMEASRALAEIHASTVSPSTP